MVALCCPNCCIHLLVYLVHLQPWNSCIIQTSATYILSTLFIYINLANIRETSQCRLMQNS